jgi:hypothetical protein
MVTIQTN